MIHKRKKIFTSEMRKERVEKEKKQEKNYNH